MQKIVICILGMHRSGTSLITKAAQEMGVYLGSPDRIMQPKENNNTDGFWEHLDAVAINEGILKFFDRNWHSTDALPDRWWESEAVIPFKEKMSELIRKEFSQCTLWGWKDPRTCITFPLWEKVLNEMNILPVFILPFRNPLSVAASLYKRDQMPYTHGLRLWLFYTLHAIEYSKGHKRIFVNYDGFLNDPLKHTRIMAEFIMPGKEDIALPSVIKQDLRHHRYSMEELKERAPKGICELYEKLVRAERDTNYDSFQFNPSASDYDDFSCIMDVGSVDRMYTRYVSSLFVDVGQGYSEAASIKKSIALDDDMLLEYDLSGYETINNLRFDPIEGDACVCSITQVETDGQLEQIVPRNGVRNATEADEFITNDPIYDFKGNFKEATYLKINIRVTIMDKPDVIRQFIQTQKVLETAQQKNAVLSTSLSQSKDEIAELRLVIEKKDSALAGQTDAFAAEKNTLNAEKDKLSCRVNELEENSRKITSQIDELEEMNKILTVRVKEHEEKNQALTYQVNAHEEKNRALTRQVNEHEEKNRALSGQVKMLEEKNRTLGVQLDELRIQCQKLRTDCIDLDRRFRNTFSWKITRPIRGIRLIVLKILGRGE